MAFLSSFRTPENGNEAENGGWVGLRKWWQMPANDPFNDVARLHDLHYLAEVVGPTQSEADRLFLDQCLAIAGDSLYLKARALLLLRRHFGGSVESVVDVEGAEQVPRFIRLFAAPFDFPLIPLTYPGGYGNLGA